MKNLKGCSELQQTDPKSPRIKARQSLALALMQIEHARRIGAALARERSGTAGEESSGPDMPDALG